MVPTPENTEGAALRDDESAGPMSDLSAAIKCNRKLGLLLALEQEDIAGVRSVNPKQADRIRKRRRFRIGQLQERLAEPALRNALERAQDMTVMTHEPTGGDHPFHDGNA